MGPPDPPTKRDIAEHLLSEGSIFVHFVPASAGVVLPEHLRDESDVLLQFGFGLAIPIPDLALDENSISGTLSFSRRGVFCRVPWDSVFAIVGEDGRTAMWTHELPPALRREIEAREQAKNKHPQLRLVEGGAPDRDASVAAEKAAPEKPAAPEKAPAKRPEPSLAQKSVQKSPERTSTIVESHPPPARKPNALETHRMQTSSAPPRPRPDYLRVVK